MGWRVNGCLAAFLMLAQPAVAQWQNHDVTDHLRSVVGTGAALEGRVVEQGRSSQAARLTVNCSDKATTVFVSAGFVTVGGNVAVSYVVDDGPVVRQTWSVCRTSDCVGLWQGAGIGLAKRLMGAKTLKISIHRPSLHDLDATFYVYGADVALQKAGRVCGWLPAVKSGAGTHDPRNG